MINMDKLTKYIPEQIINTINLLAKENNRPQLEKWLNECKQEIDFRQANKIDLSWLYYEKYYLEMILN